MPAIQSVGENLDTLVGRVHVSATWLPLLAFLAKLESLIQDLIVDSVPGYIFLAGSCCFAEFQGTTAGRGYSESASAMSSAA